MCGSATRERQKNMGSYTRVKKIDRHTRKSFYCSVARESTGCLPDRNLWLTVQQLEHLLSPLLCGCAVL